MEFLTQLWMPILASGLVVWIASFFMHMVLPHHKGEWKGLTNEGPVMAALKGVAAGQYMFPFCDMAQMKDPAMQAKVKEGPNGTVTVWAGPVNMGRNLLLSLLTYFVIGAFVAFIGWSAMEGEVVKYMDVFRLCSVTAFAAHFLGIVSFMVWFQIRGFWTYLFDSLVFALLTAGVFGWLWPH